MGRYLYLSTHYWVGVIPQRMTLTARTIFLIGLGIYFLSAIVPTAISNFFNASTVGWDAGTAALWNIIPLAVVGLLVMKYAPGGGKGE